MKGTESFKRRLCALTAAVMLLTSAGAGVSAEFTDPAEAYYRHTNNIPDYNTDNGVTDDETDGGEVYDDETGDDEINGDETDDGETPDDGAAAAEKPAVTVKKPASEITVNSYKTSAYVGETFKIGYRLRPSNSDDAVTYSSSDSFVAAVNSEGKVSAVGKGSATITVTTTSGVKDTFSITVKEKPGASGKKKGGATAIELKHSSISIYEGDKYTIPFELSPADCTDSITFRSMNRAVASVTSMGVITARGSGSTWIVLETGSGKTARLKVTVNAVLTDKEKQEAFEASGEKYEKEYDADGNLVPSLVRFGEESVSVRVGSKVSLNARVYPSGSKYRYTIKSDNASVARVSVKGEVTGVSEGTAVITITTDNGKSDSVYVTVYGDVVPGIDVSKWNGKINWKKVKATGKAEFAMIRASYGYEDTDPRLDENVRGCEANGIPYGFYHYMYAKNVTEAHKEAAYFLKTIRKYSPEYPVVLDIEEEFYDTMSKKEVTAIVKAFMEDVEDAGYYAMIYSFAKFFDKNLNMSQIKDYDIWVACWGDEEKLFENYSYHYGMWQYSETGKLDGIEEDVDLNYCYKDYREIIKKYGLNIPR